MNIQKANINQLEKIILEAFSRHAPEAPSQIIQSAEKQTGIKLSNINKSNYEVFLNEMTTEMSKFIDPWKAKFVSGVMKQLIKKACE
ncbi:MAG: hypothetical protein HQK49_07495 [Oligoflexia bacterium]|nr:hypothetical protein [Oligoflexia bacterium]